MATLFFFPGSKSFVAFLVVQSRSDVFFKIVFKILVRKFEFQGKME